MMKKIAILGTGGFARELAALIHDINAVSPTYDLIGFVDGSLAKGTLINGYPVIGNDDEINNVTEELGLVLAFGDPKLKKKVKGKFTNSLLFFPTLIHPTVIIGNKQFVEIGKGCVICAGCILTTNIIIKDFVTLNLQCTVGHDTTINDYSSFMPACNISGEVNVGEGVYCGTGVKIINMTSIGDYTIVGAGAVIAKSLPAKCTAVGVPAKPIKYHK